MSSPTVAEISVVNAAYLRALKRSEIMETKRAIRKARLLEELKTINPAA